MTLISESAEQTEAFGRRLGAVLEPGAVVALQGPLGAGKTVLTKGIAKGLGITTTITSPSFMIAVEHPGTIPLLHIDLYRTGSDEELELLGFDELTSGNGVAVIEWGDKAAHLLGRDYVQLTITIQPGGVREIILTDTGGSIPQSFSGGVPEIEHTEH